MAPYAGYDRGYGGKDSGINSDVDDDHEMRMIGGDEDEHSRDGDCDVSVAFSFFT